MKNIHTTPSLSAKFIKNRFNGATLAITGVTLALLISGPIVAKAGSVQHQETSQWSNVFKAAEELRVRCGDKGPVVMAFDLDNTIMAVDGEFASEQWFDWQETLVNTSAEKTTMPLRACGTIPALLAADTALKEVLQMHPTESALPRLLSSAQKNGILTFVLTSRSPIQELLTLRELNRNGLNFGASTIEKVRSEEFLPYDLSNLQPSGLSPADTQKLSLGKPRNVKFSNGVFLTAGQNKGAMFRILLREAGIRPCAVIFSDNKRKYSLQVEQAFADQSVDVATFRYSRQDQTMDKLLSCANIASTYEDPAVASIKTATPTLNCTERLDTLAQIWRNFQIEHKVQGCD